jgi:hypothetical protein
VTLYCGLDVKCCVVVTMIQFNVYGIDVMTDVYPFNIDVDLM